jgi:hypothetical protein
VLESNIVVIDGENLILGTIDEEETRAVEAIESAILEERETVRCFGLELLEVVAVAVFVAECRCKAMNVLAEDLLVKDCVHTQRGTRGGSPHPTIRGRTCDAYHHQARQHQRACHDAYVPF